MSEGGKKLSVKGEKVLTVQEQQAKIYEVRKLVGQLTGKLAIYCSNASISRYLHARNWNVKKAAKMLKDSLKWRAEYQPEEIRWEEIAHEAQTGKVYRSNYLDKYGRTVLVIRPSCQNTKSTKGQIRYLVYCMENAILNLPSDQEQMVWLIDFNGFNLSQISLKQTKETASVLQNHYPERLGLAILYNPPKFFEPFWVAAKALLEPKTHNKVKFVYSDERNTMKIMEDLFDMEQLESAFGGKDTIGFDISKYAERMKEEDKRIPLFWTKESSPSAVLPPAPVSLDSLKFSTNSDPSDEDITDRSVSDWADSEIVSVGGSTPDINCGRTELDGVHTDLVLHTNEKVST